MKSKLRTRSLTATLVVALSACSGDTGAPDAHGPGGRGGAPGQPMLVVAEAVGVHTFIDTIEAIGTARANESVTLTAKLTDTVSAVAFEDGDFVERGVVLLELTNEEQTALLAEAKANLDDAKRQLDRVEGLARQGSVPISQADEARARNDASRARYEAIVARLDDRLIRAPFAGVLGFRRVSPGTLVTPGTPITTIDDVSIVKLDFTVPEVYLAGLRPGLVVTATSAAYPDREFMGEVNTIDSRIDPVTRAAVVRAHIDNPDRILRPGMLLTVNIERPAAERLAVRESAVLQSGDSAFVYVVEDGIARRREITTGQREPGWVEIRDGLAEGDVVVTEGMIKIRDGAPVRTSKDASMARDAEAGD